VNVELGNSARPEGVVEAVIKNEFAKHKLSERKSYSLSHVGYSQ